MSKRLNFVPLSTLSPPYSLYLLSDFGFCAIVVGKAFKQRFIMKTYLLSLSAVFLTIGLTPTASAHCQVPCGIYADDTVFATMHTDQKTIAKAMMQIEKLSAAPTKNANQLTRWINNKEKHAQAIQDTVASYFLAQRIKINEKDAAAYTKKLTLLHKITVYAMKCKQSTNAEDAENLHKALDTFQAAYANK